MKVRINTQTFADGVPKHWLGNRSILENHVLNTLSLMFPDGERFFMRAVRRYVDKVRDNEQLRKDVKIFIGQEAQHGAAHERFNKAVAKAVAPMGWFMWLFTVPTFQWLEPALEKLNDLGQSATMPAFALSLTAAAENMTAGFAQMVFASGVLEETSQQDIRELFAWHAAEEIEHRDLAFDLLAEVDGDYGMRMAGMAGAYGAIFGYVVLGTAWLLANDEEYNWAELPGDLMELFTKEHAIGRVFLGGLADYIRPNFHPSDHPAHPKIVEYLEKTAKVS